jgi:hypothetical protein
MLVFGSISPSFYATTEIFRVTKVAANHKLEQPRCSTPKLLQTTNWSNPVAQRQASRPFFNILIVMQACIQTTKSMCHNSIMTKCKSLANDWGQITLFCDLHKNCRQNVHTQKSLLFAPALATIVFATFVQLFLQLCGTQMFVFGQIFSKHHNSTIPNFFSNLQSNAQMRERKCCIH